METTKPSMEQFFTRQQANEGIELSLSLPDGTVTQHSIRIRGVDSDIFKRADAASRRKMLELSVDLDKEKVQVELQREKLKLIASLVISWTFDREFTPANVLEFLEEAPQIADQVDRLASRRSLFFSKGSPPSTPTQVASSS